MHHADSIRCAMLAMTGDCRSPGWTWSGHVPGGVCRRGNSSLLLRQMNSPWTVSWSVPSSVRTVRNTFRFFRDDSFTGFFSPSTPSPPLPDQPPPPPLWRRGEREREGGGGRERERERERGGGGGRQTDRQIHRQTDRQIMITKSSYVRLHSVCR